LFWAVESIKFQQECRNEKEVGQMGEWELALAFSIDWLMEFFCGG
jgi:hypothetical protein